MTCCVICTGGKEYQPLVLHKEKLVVYVHLMNSGVGNKEDISTAVNEVSEGGWV